MRCKTELLCELRFAVIEVPVPNRQIISNSYMFNVKVNVQLQNSLACKYFTKCLITTVVHKRIPFHSSYILYTGNYTAITVHWELYCNYCTLGIILQLLYAGNYTAITVRWELYCNYCTLGIILQLLYTGNYTAITIHWELLFEKTWYFDMIMWS